MVAYSLVFSNFEDGEPFLELDVVMVGTRGREFAILNGSNFSLVELIEIGNNPYSSETLASFIPFDKSFRSEDLFIKPLNPLERVMKASAVNDFLGGIPFSRLIFIEFVYPLQIW